jgi:hypothetical protein
MGSKRHVSFERAFPADLSKWLDFCELPGPL